MVFFFVMRQDNTRAEGGYIGRKKGVERMKNIDLLVEEHDCILKLVESIEEAAFQMYEMHQVPVEDLRLIIDCIRIRNVSVPQRLYKVSSNSSK